MQFLVEIAQNAAHQHIRVLQAKSRHHVAQLFDHRARRGRANGGDDQAIHLRKQRVILRAGEFLQMAQVTLILVQRTEQRITFLMPQLSAL